jgi:tetratricopeptide (TPR) repeat protein
MAGTRPWERAGKESCVEKPLCFVLMPFGIKKDPGGGPDIDFDPIYEQAIRPGIEAAGMEAIRADAERTGGIIHKAMFERLLLCDYAVADLTTANPNVFYELGVRHAVRPATTLSIYALRQKLPFDTKYLRSVTYELADNNRFTPEQAAALRNSITGRLTELKEMARTEPAVDSPIFQLLNGYGAPDIARLKTDTFRDQARYSTDIKKNLATARKQRDAAAIEQIETSLGSFDAVESGVLVDLLLSYRALSAWQKMADLYQRLPTALQRSVMIREQYGFALNRLKRRDEALEVLQGVVEEQGPSSETCGLIGRIYKDRWMEARTDNEYLAQGYLDEAIRWYVQGFEADWRDAYPGINAVTLLDVRGDSASEEKKAEMLPVVRYAVSQRLRRSKPDYWDYATLLELAVLDNDEKSASRLLGSALANQREPWESQTTANNLSVIAEARAARGVAPGWVSGLLNALNAAAMKPATAPAR